MGSLSPKVEKDLHKLQDGCRDWLLKRCPILWKPLLFFIALIIIWIVFGRPWPRQFNDGAKQLATPGSGQADVAVTPQIPVTTKLDGAEQLKRPGIIQGSSIITDFSDWEGYPEISGPKNDSVICPNPSPYFPEGRMMYYPIVIGPDRSTVLSFTPESLTKNNFVVEYKKYFRCIIGNGNYQDVVCQVPPYGTIYLIEKIQKKDRALINKWVGIKPKKNLILKMNWSPIVDTEKLRLKMSLDFIPANTDDGKYLTQSFEYDIPTGKHSESINSQFGVGIIDPVKYRSPSSDVCARIESLEL